MTELPYITADLEGLGGRLKASPADFKVEELPLYQPEGQGPHVYIRLGRAGLGTRETAAWLAALFKTDLVNIGYAGLKDKNALTFQDFSLLTALSPNQAAAAVNQAGGGLTAAPLGRHRNKLKVGHLLGNRFTIVLRGLKEPAAQALPRARELAGRLKNLGLPNYFGPQRFGYDGGNAAEARSLLARQGQKRGWRDKFLCSALQSAIYNAYLAARIRRGAFMEIHPGDICKKLATGGLFTAADGPGETKRLRAGEITSTGPIFGRKMKAAAGEPGLWEEAALAEEGLSLAAARALGTGDRRPNRIIPDGLQLAEGPAEDSLIFKFSLPKGSYATVLMREFIKDDQLFAEIGR